MAQWTIGFFYGLGRLLLMFVTNFANVLAMGAFEPRLFRERGTTGQSKPDDQQQDQGLSDSLHTLPGAGLVRSRRPFMKRGLSNRRFHR